MSFKFTKIDKKTLSKESFDFEDFELDIENEEEGNINQINNYKINNNLSSKLASDKYKNKIDDSLKNLEKNKLNDNINNDKKYEEIEIFKTGNEQEPQNKNQIEKNQTNNKTNTQYYELTTNGLVEKIRNEYDEIYIHKQNDINNFIEKLANENCELKLQISKLNLEIIKLKVKNELNTNNNLLQNLNQNIDEEKINKTKKEMQITSEKIELEKKNIKEEYNFIIQNISSNIISKNIKSLYDKLIKSKNDLINSQKINCMLQEENEKLKSENYKIKLDIIEEKNKIIEKIIEIQTMTNSDIDLNKNLIYPIYDNNYSSIIKIAKTEENQNEIDLESDKSNNNVYIYYIEKIKNLTYEKNKLLTSNYDFFVKINDLSQIIEEKNNIINEQLKLISSSDLKVLNLEQQINSMSIKHKAMENQLKEAQEKINDLTLEKVGNIVFEEKILEHKNNISKKQLENKTAQLNKSLDELTLKNTKLNNNLIKLKEINEKISEENLLQKEENIKEKNKLLQDINRLKEELKIKEEKIIITINEYENKIKNIKESFGNDSNKNNNNVDMEQIQLIINEIYDKIYNNNLNNINKNINENISLFVKNNINIIVKLNEISKQINNFYKKDQIYSLITEENEKLKNHIKDIINLTLEKTSITYIKKFKEDFINISFEQLILKIINYLKVYKVCFLLQKIKTSVSYSEKYISWLNEKDFFKNNNSSFEEFKFEINNIEKQIDYIKNTLKNNSFEFEQKIKNFLSKEEVKIEVNNIQKKYEKVITDIFEYFLKYKIINKKNNDKENLTLKIPIQSYNLMIENNMNNLSLISQSIDLWNVYVNNDLNENNDNVFQEILNMTNIRNALEYNNISDIITNNNNNEENNQCNQNENVEENSNNQENDSNKDNEENENDYENKEIENKNENEIDSKINESESQRIENESQNFQDDEE